MTDAAQRVPGQLPDFPGAVVHSGVVYTSGVVDESALHGSAAAARSRSTAPSTA